MMQPFDKHPADVGALRDRAREALELAAATRAAYQPARHGCRGDGRGG